MRGAVDAVQLHRRQVVWAGREGHDAVHLGLQQHVVPGLGHRRGDQIVPFDWRTTFIHRFTAEGTARGGSTPIARSELWKLSVHDP